MLVDKASSCVVLVDVQDKLTPLIHNHEKLITNCQWVCQLARELDVPIIVSEQYPKGLGHTIPALQPFVTDTNTQTKVAFSCAADTACMQAVEQTGAQQIILVGIEAHVCVLQTAIGLRERGFEVFVVADAVSSRDAQAANLALSRMRHSTVDIINREMLLFEWLREAGTDSFRSISQLFLKGDTWKSAIRPV